MTVSIPELPRSFHGRVIAPGDDSYDHARTLFYGGMVRRPAVIIRPSDADEVLRDRPGYGMRIPAPPGTAWRP
jgi:hypothetical protein